MSPTSTTEAEERPGFVSRVLAWLRAGYPEGVPQQDYVALLGLLQRNLTHDELDRVVAELATTANERDDQMITATQVQARIEDLLKGPATTDDVLRVASRLAAAGWPLGPLGKPRSVERENLLARIVGWLREGYPAGLPEHDFIPLVALLRRRLSDAEVVAVAQGLIASGVLPDRIDVADAIAEVTTELPSDTDIARVRASLLEHGWPVDFAV